MIALHAPEKKFQHVAAGHHAPCTFMHMVLLNIINLLDSDIQRLYSLEPYMRKEAHRIWGP